MFTQNIIVGQGYDIALLYTLTSTALARNEKGHSNKSDGDFLGFNGYKYPNLVLFKHKIVALNIFIAIIFGSLNSNFLFQITREKSSQFSLVHC